MEGFEVKFNIYAFSQKEADEAASAIKSFISTMAQQGVAVTADKLTAAVNRWRNNSFVINYFK
jgi:hypothetical protein